MTPILFLLKLCHCVRQAQAGLVTKKRFTELRLLYNLHGRAAILVSNEQLVLELEGAKVSMLG